MITVVTDCKELILMYNKPLEFIKNRRIVKMLLDVTHLNLSFEFIRGIKNATADFRSQEPRLVREACSEDEVPIKLRLGIRTVKAQKLQLEAIKPRLEKVGELARTDAEYQEMVKHTEQETEDKFLEEGPDLKKMGTGRKHLGVYVDKNGNKLLVKNLEEVLTPQVAREEVLQELHATHLSADGMKRLARGKLHWVGMGKDIEKLARECKSCQENARSKPNANG